MEPKRQDSEEISDLLLRLRNYDGPWWDRKYLATIQDFYGFLRNLRVGTAPKGLRYMHFAFTHFPVDFDENCGYHGDEPQWYADSQNEAGAIKENECALKQFGALLDRLEEIGAYESSLIILLSDHGKPSAYYSASPDDYRVNGHEIFGFGRFRPFLAIKKPGGRAEQPLLVNELVVLDDVAPTVCAAAGVNSNCQQFPGIDLLGDDLASVEPYFLYVPQDKRATHIYDTHRQVVLSRAMGLLESMRAADGVESVEASP
jgi:arylsulfatase A-like enzyme